MEQNTMTFPEEEHSSIISRLNQGKLCYTTRVFRELGRYLKSGRVSCGSDTAQDPSGAIIISVNLHSLFQGRLYFL